MQSFSPSYHKAALECLHISNIARHVEKMSAKRQIAVDVTCEISPQCALLLAVVEAAGIYSCSPPDLQTGSQSWAFCTDYQELPSVEMIYCLLASH